MYIYTIQFSTNSEQLRRPGPFARGGLSFGSGGELAFLQPPEEDMYLYVYYIVVSELWYCTAKLPYNMDV